MKRFHFANWLPVVALALALPAWATGPSDESKQNATPATSDQSNAASSTKDQHPKAASKGEGHGPTAVMDRATPTGKSSTSESSNKHPPTARMDRSTPNQKSPASKSKSDADANTTEAPGTAK